MKFFKILLLTFYFINTTNASIPLVLNLKKGETYKIRSTSNKYIQVTVNEQPMVVTVYSNSVISIKPISIEKEVILIEMAFDTINNKTISPAGKSEIVFTKPAKNDDYLGQIRNRFCTFKLIAKISTVGRFINFVNYQPFKKSIMEVMKSVPDAQKEEVQKQAENLLKEAYLQSMVEPFFAYLPEKLEDKGNKWESSYILASDKSNLLLFNTFTLLNVENNVAKISCSTEIESMPANESTKSLDSQMLLVLKGTSTSDLSVDLNTGLQLHCLTKGHSKGTAKMNIMGKEMEMPTVVDSQLEITLKYK